MSGLPAAGERSSSDPLLAAVRVDGIAAPTPRVRLVATDLDGTLLDPSGRVTSRTARAVEAARAAGIHVVPVTARPPQALWALAAEAGVGPLAVCANGAAIVDLAGRRVIEVEQVPGPVATDLVDRIRTAAPGVVLALDDLECFSFEGGFFDVPVDWQEKLEEVADARAVVARGCVKLLARLPGSAAPVLAQTLATALGELCHVTTSGLDWVDVGAAGVSKAGATARVCELLGIGFDEVVAIGDNHNDLPLLAWAATPMAPANAIPEVLASVTRILASNSEDGVAALLEELARTARSAAPDCAGSPGGTAANASAGTLRPPSRASVSPRRASTQQPAPPVPPRART